MAPSSLSKMRTIPRAVAGMATRTLVAGWHRHDVSIAAYHGATDAAAFNRQLLSLRAHHTFISPDDLRRWLEGGELPPHPMLLTFDDGERSVLENAAPVLHDLGIRALLFVVAGLLDSYTPFWWDEVAGLAAGGHDEVRRLKRLPDDARRAAVLELRERGPRLKTQQLTTNDLGQLMDAGFEIGNHSFDHPCLDQCSAEEAVRQIERAHEALVERGITPTAFAYPNGNLDERIEPTLRNLGYDLGFVFDHRHTRRQQDPLRLSRLRLDANASPERAALIASGVHGAIMRLRRRGG